MNNYYEKYIKYKNKYLSLKKQFGSSELVTFSKKRLLPFNETEQLKTPKIFSKNGELGVWSELPNELYVIGDIHGDFYALKQALELTGCVNFEEYSDKLEPQETFFDNKEIIYDIKDGCNFYIHTNGNVKWNKDKQNCFIVFAGDLIDRCRYHKYLNSDCSNTVNDENCDYKILQLLLYLDEEAKKYNSRVITIIGNHELMNLNDRLEYVSIKGINDNGRRNNIKQFIINNINKLFSIVRINHYIIAHGGINDLFFEELNKKYNDESLESIEIFNKLFRENITNQYKFYLNQNIAFKSPFWDRTIGGFDPLNENQCKKILDENLLNIKPFMKEFDHLKLIVAHCVQFPMNKSINLNDCQEYSNRIYRIDVGMSRAFDEYIPNIDSKLYNILINDYNDFYKNENNINEYRKVSILKVINNLEEIVQGETSIDYFYKTVFKTKRERLLYLLSDLFRIYNYKYQFATENRNIRKLLKLILEKIRSVEKIVNI